MRSPLAARLHHSGIVPVVGLGEHDGLHNIAIQCNDGCGLDRELASADEPDATGNYSGTVAAVIAAINSQ